MFLDIKLTDNQSRVSISLSLGVNGPQVQLQKCRILECAHFVFGVAISIRCFINGS